MPPFDLSLIAVPPGGGTDLSQPGVESWRDEDAADAFAQLLEAVGAPDIATAESAADAEASGLDAFLHRDRTGNAPPATRRDPSDEDDLASNAALGIVVPDLTRVLPPLPPLPPSAGSSRSGDLVEVESFVGAVTGERSTAAAGEHVGEDVGEDAAAREAASYETNALPALAADSLDPQDQPRVQTEQSHRTVDARRALSAESTPLPGSPALASSRTNDENTADANRSTLAPTPTATERAHQILASAAAGIQHAANANESAAPAAKGVGPVIDTQPDRADTAVPQRSADVTSNVPPTTRTSDTSAASVEPEANTRRAAQAAASISVVASTSRAGADASASSSADGGSQDALRRNISRLPLTSTLVSQSVTTLLHGNTSSPAPVWAFSPAAVQARLADALSGEDAPLHNQIVRAMQMLWRGGAGEARLTLHPEYLGELSINLKVDQGAMTAVLHVQEPEVRAWVQAHEGLLRQGLQEQGLRLERLTVSDEQPGSDQGRRQDADAQRDRRSARRWTSGEAPTFEVAG